MAYPIFWNNTLGKPNRCMYCGNSDIGIAHLVCEDCVRKGRGLYLLFRPYLPVDKKAGKLQKKCNCLCHFKKPPTPKEYAVSSYYGCSHCRIKNKLFDCKSGYWLKGLGLSGSQVDYIRNCVNEFIKLALKEQKEKIKRANPPNIKNSK